VCAVSRACNTASGRDRSEALTQESGRWYCNFHGYSSHRYYELIDFGLSAISQVGDRYAQNSSDLALYRERLDVPSVGQ